MTNQDNDKFEETIRSLAQDYNRPPANVPRDEMWTVIEAARTERARRPLHIVPPASQPRFTRYTWMGLAAAAVFLIATGVGIGRWSNSPSAPRVANENQKPPTTLPPGGEAIKSPQEPEASTQVAVAEPEVIGAPRTSQAPDRATRGTQRGTQVAVAIPPSSVRGAPETTGSVPYQVATIRHLSNAEALLTAFRSDSRDAKLDASLSIWARDLLSNTRLLLDSPAADDPTRAKLLGDLELVLAEIVQLAPNATAQDRGLVEGSIRNGNVMTRLRSAIPAGQTRGL
jgi:hypothetical protein